jgi:hypothetical protein
VKFTFTFIIKNVDWINLPHGPGLGSREHGSAVLASVKRGEILD